MSILTTKQRKRLAKRLRPKTTKPFEALGDVQQTKHGPLIYQDNGANILAVGHLDFVKYAKPTISKDLVRCPQLDDRLGVWVILDILKEAGLKFDVLLTDSEEVGQSTAQYFESPKKYNWMFEFDRMGTDVVMYDFHTQELALNLEDHGFDVGYGSFTDICYLEQLGVAGFNFGVGYHNQHTDRCYADLNQTYENVVKFCHFYETNKDIEFPFDPNYAPPKSRSNSGSSVVDSWADLDARDSYDNSEWWSCKKCQSDLVYHRGVPLCVACDHDYLINSVIGAAYYY